MKKFAVLLALAMSSQAVSAGDIFSSSAAPGMTPKLEGFAGDECVMAARTSAPLDRATVSQVWTETPRTPIGDAKWGNYAPAVCPSGYYMTGVGSTTNYYNNHGKSYDDIAAANLRCCKYK